MKSKILSKTTSIILGLMIILSSVLTFGLAASAADPTIDPAQKGSLSIYKYLGETKDPDKQIKDDSVGYTIYRVGYLVQTKDSSGNVTVSYNTSADGSGTPINVSALNPKTYDTTGLVKYGENFYDADEGSIYFDGLPLGLYLVKETTTPPTVVASNNFFVQIPMSTADGWIYDVVAEPKNKEYDGSVSKKVDGGSSSSANLGGEVSYTIEAILPTDIAQYEKFNIVDTASEYLTMSDFVITSDQGTNYATPADYTILTVTNPDNTVTRTIEFTAAGIAKMQDGEKLTVTYKGTIASNAPINTALKNSAHIDYDKGGEPGTVDPEPEDPDPEVYVYSYAFKKVGSDDKDVGLPNAEFILQDSQGNYIKQESDGSWSTTTNKSDAHVFKSDNNGIVSFIGFKEGNYTVTEIKAPNGYALLSDSFTITINKDSTTVQQAGNTSITVVNQEDGTSLPGTGGKGIYMFYAVGGLIMLFAGVMFLRARKKSAISK